MAESHNLGQKGEDLAADHLEKAGFKILSGTGNGENMKLIS